MSEEKKRINVWITESLYSQLIEPGRPGITEIVIQALTAYLKNEENKPYVSLNEQLEARVQDLNKTKEILTSQLDTKDLQIEALSEASHKQAVHIQTLIQELGNVNNRLLSESNKVKKWFEFWK